MFIISLVMDVELSLLKFINHYTKHNPDDNGQKYSEEQANLIETFGYSFVENIHPRVFEKNITENKIKLKSKRVKSDFVKISLNPVQILHFKLLYNIAYIKCFYPAKISKFNFSEDLSELLDNEEEIINLYTKIKQIGLS
ncbi:hypothetical protein OAD05_00845 [Candidatus Pelagibacter sp.]|jgi:hypothetical protein|nr:hypothetical protein [Candidatus Pelagibacter sp.]